MVAGIGVTTLSEWREKRPEIEQRMEQARETARQKALQAIKAAGQKDWRAWAEWLRLTFPADYRGRPEVNVMSQTNVQIAISPEQLADIRSRLEATREAFRLGHTSAAGGRRENEAEIDAKPSRQNLSEKADFAPRPALPESL